MEMQFAALIPVVFAVVKAAERLGLKRSLAHLCALPLGILVSFLVITDQTIPENIIFGLLIGFGAIGTDDTVCNSRQAIKCKMFGKDRKSGKSNKNE